MILESKLAMQNLSLVGSRHVKVEFARNIVNVQSVFDCRLPIADTA